ncbi:hypothetical protein HELRODRAFT_67647, partial [Helobdella robusta]|uniref:Fibronectin type-III domain-containing protein n=1 Tax=Helobdella robusta TaxID=6412 RepID=T1FZ32_HELRO
YELRLTNNSGEVSAEVSIKVISAPSSPRQLAVRDIFKEKCRLRWEEPDDDGGVGIEKYIIEVHDVTDNKKRTITESSKQCIVNNLAPGHLYKFKVKAVNAEGESDWLLGEDETLAKDPWGVQPGTPVVIDFDKDRAEIQWTASKKDGGSPILKYVIEKRQIGSTEWQTVGMVPPEELCAIVPDLLEGERYEFRVVSVNKAGRGEYSDPSEPVTIKATKIAAKIDHTSYESSLKVKAGHDFHLEILYYGQPVPIVEWTSSQGDPLIDDPDHFTVRTSQNCSMLSCKECKRNHSLKYVATVRNMHGSDSATIDVHVVDTPGKPTGSLQLSNIRKSSVVLKWEHPVNTGGKPITNYVVEKRQMDLGVWDQVSHFVPATTCELKVDKLQSGEAYLFRIAAENEEGRSEYLVCDEPVVVENKFG